MFLWCGVVWHGLTWRDGCAVLRCDQVLHYCYAVVGVVWFAGKYSVGSPVTLNFDTFTAAIRTLFQVRVSVCNERIAMCMDDHRHCDGCVCLVIVDASALHCWIHPQLMTGEAWNDIMYASVDAHGSLGVTVYYLTCAWHQLFACSCSGAPFRLLALVFTSHTCLVSPCRGCPSPTDVSVVLLLFSNVFIGLVVDRFQVSGGGCGGDCCAVHARVRKRAASHTMYRDGSLLFPTGHGG